MTFVAAAIAGAAVVGAGASIYSANKAVGAQSASAAAANATQQAQYEQTRSDSMPWHNAGSAAVNKLALGMGLTTSPTFDGAAYLASNPDVAAQPYWAANPEAHYNQHGQAEGRAATMTGGSDSSQAGFGSLTKSFGASDFTADPGYAFRLSQGQNALNNSAAARGGVLSGAQLKGASTFNQNFASNEYGNAYNRFNTDQNAQFNRLASVAGTGQTANGTVATAGTNAANQISNNQTGAGNAQASSYLATGNALQSGMNQVVSAYNGYSGANSLSNQNYAMAQANPWTTQGQDINAFNGAGSTPTGL